MGPFYRIGRWRINNRDHRKILLVDGKVAFTGGVNITAAYARSSLFRSRAKNRASVGWRETHIQIEGPAVTAHITAAYFAPDAQIMKALLDAARRGVDVKIVLPSVSDGGPVIHAGRSFYTRMLEAGVRVDELRTSVLHAKTAVIDGSWSTVGSTNLDMRSFLHNFEMEEAAPRFDGTSGIA